MIFDVVERFVVCCWLWLCQATIPTTTTTTLTIIVTTLHKEKWDNKLENKNRKFTTETETITTTTTTTTTNYRFQFEIMTSKMRLTTTHVVVNQILSKRKKLTKKKHFLKWMKLMKNINDAIVLNNEEIGK